MAESVLYEKSGAVGRITLNRPDKFNSVNGDLAKALREALDACKEDAEVRCIYLTGAGRAFCAGQDLQEVLGADDNFLSTILSERLNPIVRRLRELEKPVVAAVNGVAAGAGANIALACDLVVAAESASFIQAFSKIGLIPDSGGTYFLPRLVGLQRAAAMAMLGEPVKATEAERIGLIYQSVPDAEFTDRSWKLAEQLATMPTRALALTKRAFNQSLENDFEKQLAIEEQLQVTAGRTTDYKEGVAAFVEKRKAVFRGQ